MKLKAKERHGARVTKKYHQARTPYQRVLESSFIDEQTKQQLRQRYQLLNPAQLKRHRALAKKAAGDRGAPAAPRPAIGNQTDPGAAKGCGNAAPAESDKPRRFPQS